MQLAANHLPVHEYLPNFKGDLTFYEVMCSVWGCLIKYNNIQVYKIWFLCGNPITTE